MNWDLQNKRNGLLLFWLFCSAILVAQPYSMVFDENKGQWDERILFRSTIPSGSMFFERSGFRYLFVNEEPIKEYLHHPADPKLPYPVTVHSHIIQVDFAGALPSVNTVPLLPNSYYSNYFIGDDPTHWATGVRSYQMLEYRSLYTGIDLQLLGNGERLKYQFVIAPGADPQQIAMKYSGQESMHVINGNLHIQTSFHFFQEKKPYCYQQIGEKLVEVEAAFKLVGNTVSFELGAYDPAYPLIIDPELIFATYSGSSADNFGHSATYDHKGNLYSAGTVEDASDIAGAGRYPATPGAFQTTFQGGSGNLIPINGGFACDIAISKYDSSGQNLIWATYLGGVSDEFPYSLIVDDKEQLVVFGTTFSTNFPKVSGCYDTANAGSLDMFLVKFNAGATALIGATFIGGENQDGLVDEGVNNPIDSLVYNYADHFRGEVLIDSGNFIYVAATTRSKDFPVTGNAFQKTLRGGTDGVLFALDSNLKNLVWSTYIGGTMDDALYSIRFDANGDILAAGGTVSNNLPVTSDAIQKGFAGGRADAFFLRVKQKNRSLSYLSYYGTSSYDQAYFSDIDLKGRYYLFGQTEGTMTRTAGTYGQNGGGLFFLMLSADLRSVQYVTTIGSMPNSPNLSPSAFLVDRCGKIYFSGWGSDFGNFGYHAGSTFGLPTYNNPIRSYTDGEDFYLGVMDRNFSGLWYATFFGGDSTADHVDGGTSRFDKNGIVYHSNCGSCPNGPQGYISDIQTTPNAAFPLNFSPRCSNFSFKLDFQANSAVEARMEVEPPIACYPEDVTFRNVSILGKQFFWDFGDGNKDTAHVVTHTYTQPGKYTVTLIAIDSSTCNVNDTAVMEVNMIGTSIAGFEYETDPCTRAVVFTNTSTGALLNNWYFSDGDSSEEEHPTHVFAEDDEYTVNLIINAGTPCADTFSTAIEFNNDTPDIFIPNVFTPNTDGLNPCYTFGGMTECVELEVEIYNRWAQLLYEYKDEETPFCWDGTWGNGRKLSLPGVYYVIARYRQRGQSQWTEYKGTVTIIY